MSDQLSQQESQWSTQNESDFKRNDFTLCFISFLHTKSSFLSNVGSSMWHTHRCFSTHVLCRSVVSWLHTVPLEKPYLYVKSLDATWRKICMVKQRYELVLGDAMAAVDVSWRNHSFKSAKKCISPPNFFWFPAMLRAFISLYCLVKNTLLPKVYFKFFFQKVSWFWGEKFLKVLLKLLEIGIYLQLHSNREGEN